MRNKTSDENHSGWKGIVSLFTVRNVLIVLAVIVVAGAAQRLAAAWLIPAGSIRHEVIRSIEDWTGARVVTSDNSALSFWPSAQVTVENVAIYPSSGDQTRPIMTAARVTGTFSIFSAITGNPNFSTVIIDDPTIFVSKDKDGRWNWRSGGKLQQAIADPEKSALLLSSARLADFVIRNGTVLLRSGDARIFSVKELNGTVSLPSFLSTLSVQLAATVKGRKVSFSGSSDDPIGLITGKNAPVAIQAKSDLAEFQLDGTANIGRQPFLSGSLTASTSDTPSLCSWLGLRFDAIRPLKALKLTASMTSEGTKFTLSDLKMSMTGANATGVLDVGWGAGRTIPSLSGTLAFDNFDMQAFLSAFLPLPTGLEDVPSRIDTSFLHQIRLDLRLSAGKATFKSALLSDMAASSRIRDGHASFVLAASQFGGGSLSGELNLTDENQETYSLSLQAHNVQFPQVSKLIALQGPWPDSTGNLSINLKSTMPPEVGGHRKTSGNIKASSGAGNLTQFGPDILRALANKKQFFNLSDISSGSLAFDTFSLEANVNDGLAELVSAEFKGAQNALSLRGILPYRNNSLALTGVLSNPQDGKAPKLHFFAGGAWPNIVISPFSISSRDE